MLVYYFVFAILINRRTEEFTIFLLIGITSWAWFAKSLIKGGNSIKNSSTTMNQQHFPKAILPASEVLVRTIRFMIVFAILLLFISFLKSPLIQWLHLPAVIFCQFTLITGITFLISSILPFIPDLNFMIQSGLSAMMFISGVFFEITPDNEYYDIFIINPMAKILEQYRSIILNGQSPDFFSLILISIIGFTLFVFALYLIKKFEYIYPKIT